MSWSKEQCQILLQEYQKYPCLFAIKSPLYKNKHARQEALHRIEAVVKEVRPSVTIHDIKFKFNGLKTNFMVEYKKWNGSRRSGAGNEDGTDAVYTPTIWYFKSMFFLLEHCQVRMATDSLTEQVETVEESQETECSEYLVGEDGVLEDVNNTPEYIDTPSVSPAASCSSPRQQKQKKRKIQNDVVEANLIREASNTLATINRSMSVTNYVNDEDEALAKYIITKLRKISREDVRMDVEQQILEFLHRGIKQCIDQ
ncbi:hypothetical protein RN001_004890 [Aquatica leii]|uniref:MADF domain-containing protein n=1 Tax=Aquatica leii TaxID=1421715 RepID=A0AAN7PJ14_9COLE|nr:hypothetical protein RN001_004890 [Aquatica leii]